MDAGRARPSRPRTPIGGNARRQAGRGLRGLKSAIRGDSSFFAHGYRGTLIVITAALLGVDQRGWCLLVVGACLVLIAELAHSAVDTLARAIGDPEEPRLKTAREIAAAGVLVAASGSGGGHSDGALVGNSSSCSRALLLCARMRSCSSPDSTSDRLALADGAAACAAAAQWARLGFRAGVAAAALGEFDAAQVLDVGAVVQVAGVAG